MKKLVEAFLLFSGIASLIAAYFQQSTLWLGVGVACLILLFALLVED